MEAHAGARPPCIVFWVAPPLGDGERLIRSALASCAAPPAHRIVVFGGALYRPAPHEIVLAMGQPMVAAMAAAGLVPKKRTIDSLRGRLHPSAADDRDGARTLVTFHPSSRHLDPEKAEEIAWDIRLAERLARTGSLAPDWRTPIAWRHRGSRLLRPDGGRSADAEEVAARR